MAHTKHGSFVIPVLVRLGLESRPEPRMQLVDGLFDIDPPEPIERRITRTMAEALRAVEKAIVEPQGRSQRPTDCTPLSRWASARSCA